MTIFPNISQKELNNMFDKSKNCKALQEIAIQKKQEVEEFIFVGKLTPKKNQRIFQLKLDSMIVSEVEFIYKTDTIKYMDIINDCVPDNRSILIEPDTDYVIKLNIDNALKHFQSKYNSCDITIDRTLSKSLSIHTDVSAYKN